ALHRRQLCQKAVGQVRRRLSAEILSGAANLRETRQVRPADEEGIWRLDAGRTQAARKAEGPAGHIVRSVRPYRRAEDGAPAGRRLLCDDRSPHRELEGGADSAADKTRATARDDPRLR